MPIAIEEKLLTLRDRAIVRNIDLTSQLIKLKIRLSQCQSEKLQKKYQEQIDYVSDSIRVNRDIIFKVADLDKDYQLEQ